MLKSTICIEVCQGPDCTGLGGGAALLEIEELIQEERYQEEQQHQHITTSSTQHHHQQQENEQSVVVLVGVPVVPIIHFQAEAGSCRNFCTVGPNVHISHQNRKSLSLLESYHRVKDVSSCREVVQNACSRRRTRQKNETQRTDDESCTRSHQNPTSMHSHSHENMMTRRVDRKRWEALRNISRVISKCKKDVTSSSSSLGNACNTRNASQCQKWKESCERHLDPLAKVELSAATTNGSKDRAARRSERLARNISEKLAKCYKQEESSDEESDSDSNSDSSDHSSS
mmetsp:Transcript_21378/g.31636  ORF Transcript_21378/g.31636 Transcript_21378/m.31636 type:complete len:286 (+) Transcript_21378:19-876(+)